MRDHGLLGPDSATWQMFRCPGVQSLGGMRTLIIEALHPLAMAGVAEHSSYRSKPLTRMRRTAYYVNATAFGDTRTAMETAAHVREVHRHIHGTDPVTGREYSAEDPETQVWVHTAQWYSFLVAHRVLFGGSDPELEDRFMAEGVTIAALVGTPAELVPASVAEARTYFARVRPMLCVSDGARDAIDFMLGVRPPRELLPVLGPWRLVGSAALATVPRDLRRMAGIDRPRAVDVAALAAATPALRVVGLPGFRELQGHLFGHDTLKLARDARAAAAA